MEALFLCSKVLQWKPYSCVLKYYNGRLILVFYSNNLIWSAWRKFYSNGVLALSMTCLLTSSGLHIIIHKFYSNGVLSLCLTCLLISSRLHIIIHKFYSNGVLALSMTCLLTSSGLHIIIHKFYCKWSFSSINTMSLLASL